MKPPSTIAWLVGAVGDTAALAFVESAGGRRLSVPQNWRGSKIETLYGSEIAQALSERFGGLSFDVPICRSWRVLTLYGQGLPVNDIASRVGCSRSAIFRILEERTSQIVATREQSRTDTRQMALFI